MSIERVGVDGYGRTVAMLRTDRGNLSCWQLEHKQAINKANWDNGLRVARTCPRSAL
jgi:micrococcal nuclease